MGMKVLLFPILFIASFELNKFDASSNNGQKFDKENGPSLTWKKFFNDYIKNRKPLILHNGCTDNKAYRIWSPDYVYFHPGAALTFKNMTAKASFSIRKIAEQRAQLEKLHMRLPLFLSNDLKIPDCLDCKEVTSRINTPFLMWNFQDTMVHLHDENVHELWCIMKGTVDITLIPEWPSSMLGRYVTAQVLSDDANFKDKKYFQTTIKEGECAYVPSDFLRQWKPTKDSMVIIYKIPTSLLIEHETELKNCEQAKPSSWVEFADDDDEEGVVKYNHELQRFISYLGRTDCVDFPLFWDSIINDPGLVWLDRTSTRETLAREIFDTLDTSHDGQFCWSDVDLLTLESATRLSEWLKTKQVILESGLGEFNRRAGKKIRELNLEWNDPRFLDTVWEGLVQQYGDKVGNIFDGPWVQEMREEEERKQSDLSGHKEGHMEL